jgi:uncharacterized DUF497 family protein
MESVTIVIRRLIWDDWNIEHISRHNVIPAEVELSLSDKHAVFLRAKQGRVMVLGRAKKRLLTTILNAQPEEGAFYVITARDMAKKERAYYQSQKDR